MKFEQIAILVGWLTLGATASATPSTHKEPWVNGQVVLANGHQLTGRINYNWKADVVQLQLSDGRLKAFSAHQVGYFTFYDRQKAHHRKFIAIDLPAKSKLNHKRFLEEIITGPLLVYRELRNRRELFKLADLTIYGNEELFLQNADNFNYYVFVNEAFTNLKSFNKRIWPRLEGEFKTDLNRYRLAHEAKAGIEHQHARPRPRSTASLQLLLIKRYNDLKVAHQDENASLSVL
jgi:hypothetical protein